MDLFRLSRTYRSAKRLQQIVNVLLKHGFGRVIDQIQLGRYIPFRKRLRTFGQWPILKGPTVPERLRIAFGELGPSFIKLAQILSSRPDLITAQFANEFKKLQDEVPPFPVAEAKKIISEELKVPLEDIFREFKDEPVAAASIAQVHLAKLADGSEVIVKVQRPGIREQIETDITILTALARLLDRNVPESRFFNPVAIVDEFSKTLRRELDFIGEAKNCLRFKKNFEENPDIYIPRIYGELITERVLVMERIEGVRIDDIPGITALGLDRKRLVKVSVDAYFKMILEDGFFHADPHPGNLLVMPSGMLAFVDFGIVGRVTPEMKATMAKTFLALIHRDFDKLIDQYVELGYVPEDIDLDRFRREFKTDLLYYLEPLYGLSLKEINFAQYLDVITHLALKHRMQIPSDLLLINKAMLIMENIGRELDPSFDFIAFAEPYAIRLAREKLSPSRMYEHGAKGLEELGDFLVLFPKQIKRIIRKVLRDDIHMKLTHIGLDRLITDMDRSSNRITFGMIISAILLGSAIMQSTGAGVKIFGMSVLGLLSFALAFLLGIWLLISIIKSGRL
ncbi:MAG TPA: AarF/ABC1/UbiB kinase family protein [Thermodesulfovibrionales bacterium]|nr:AarF/ABC1/UbiB kinase family protein [Thermodesulfovibrionales bacterium]